MTANKMKCSRLVIFWWPRSVNHVKLTEYVMCMEKSVLVKKKKCLQMGQTWVFHNKPELKMQSME